MRRCALILFLAAGAAQPTNLWELTGQLNKFAEHYNLFVEELNAGAFDLVQARHLSKLWRQVENSGMWPRENR